MDISKLKTFYMVALEKNISNAAHKMGVHQTSVSRTIRDLERRMDVNLIVRHYNGIELTTRGEQLFAFAERLYQQIDIFEKTFYDDEAEPQGDLLILTTPMLGSALLLPRMKSFLAENPKVTPRITLKEEDLSLTGTDVAIRTFVPNHPHLIQKKLLSAEFKIFASTDYIEKNGIPKTSADLDHHNLITYKGDYISQYGNMNWVIHVGLKKDQKPRHSYLEVNSLHGMLSATASGFGIAVMPSYALSLASNLVEINLEFSPPQVDVYFIFSEERKASEKINRLYKSLLRD